MSNTETAPLPAPERSVVTVQAIRRVALAQLALALPILLFYTLHRWVGFPDVWFVALSADLLLFLPVTLLLLRRNQASQSAWTTRMGDFPQDIQDVLYVSGQDELRFTKSLQWNTIYYILLVYGALYGIGTATATSAAGAAAVIPVLLYALDCVTLIWGIYFVAEIQYKLRNYRSQLNQTKYYKAYFVKGGRLDLLAYTREADNDARFWRDKRFTLVFIVSSVLGFVIVTLRLWSGLRHVLSDLVNRLLP